MPRRPVGLLAAALLYPVVLYPVLLVSVGVCLLENRRRLFGQDSRMSDSASDAR